MSPSKKAPEEHLSAPTPERPAPARARGAKVLAALLRVLILAAVIGLSVFLFSIRDRLQHLEVYGYPGVFIFSLISNATILMPVPGAAFAFAMGGVFHPLGVAVAAGSGGALGELTGYLAGFSGQAVIERMDVYVRIRPWVQRYGPWAILVMAAIPNPFFDLVGIAAGVMKMPIGRFLLFCWAGQVIKMIFIAYAGAFSLNWLAGFIK